MKAILSRKGFDSQYGGYPSPIMPDGSLISLPIPSNDDLRYSDLRYSDSKSYYDIMSDLKDWIKYSGKKKELSFENNCHLDPDLRRETIPRSDDWKPLFGQIGTAQTHLENKDIGEDDLFLFFGTFRKTEYEDGSLRFLPESPEIHMIFGYLQVGEIFRLEEDSSYPKWMEYHPHTDKNRLSSANNTIYAARDKLNFDSSKKGAGIFDYDDRLVLTKEGFSKSRWDLSDIFREVDISYHSEKCWKDEYFDSASRGQEFVIDCNEEVEEYFMDLVMTN